MPALVLSVSFGGSTLPRILPDSPSKYELAGVGKSNYHGLIVHGSNRKEAAAAQGSQSMSRAESSVAVFRWLVIAALLALASPSPADAHPGGGPVHGLINGFVHPLSGLDHLAAMVAVGLWAVQLGGRALWLLPIAFVSMMCLGGLIGMWGAPLPLVEPAILGSVIVFGLVIAFTAKLPLGASLAIVGIFALFHGHAHGAEMPAAAAGFAYGCGFVVATTTLHLFGVGFGITARRSFSSGRVLPYAGAAIAIVGLCLCLL
jgi:urease accessory protein